MESVHDNIPMTMIKYEKVYSQGWSKQQSKSTDNCWLFDWLMGIIHRVGPSIPIFNKVKGLIDAGADEDAILAHYNDPHLYTAMIK